ncbi:MAG: adenosylcobinamide-phosphate synthase CbiB [Limnospira sp. PMC 1291.21]|uniref:Cobalamin biosynthesis protein CobD n=3 Tax=Limnospira TaxID=2596745 RepID=A0A9P1KIM4_9CYAN|nr:MULTISPECIES: adenosylcobinamide-phosphate synthase CbiB [Limnospira]EKD08591.1 cobalamin biosynthesis protein CobD [Arthrospira platensis C1]MDC0837812.1 adenosylcobinamide-phosphate synthase CbiB [Limnoraphis robusta]MDY7055567.1 adenosylcobinamide-phosphate synthase CbiB [Limnospira fusiformis LS22]QJB24888.1 cobalamin biosynthesis protein [Limnospira fusiformis SAG 85.79]RAQ46807.1 cobalamin biosynthesis protein [Arthrospira sp. O9.13F]
MSDFPTIVILAIAAGLDYAIGDPWNWLHPVQVMGWVITKFTQPVLRYLKSPLSQKLAGIWVGLILVIGSGLVSWLMVAAVKTMTVQLPFHGIICVGLQSILLASCFAARSLRAAAEDVQEALQRGDLPTSRQRLSQYVGRDTEQLSKPEIERAIVETITENAIDGMMAPLFYGIIGLLIPAVGSVPLAWAYKAASTLDSMIGYREAPYTHIGWFSAKLEDVLTWLPCRLSVITVALLSGQPRRVWQICRRDAIHDPSPNAGWSECAYAVALGVQLGGVNQYGGKVKHKPTLGDPISPITSETIERALTITRHAVFLWLGLTFILFIIRAIFWQ